jgi:hypothetical protein
VNAQENKVIVLETLNHWLDADFLDAVTTEDFVVVMQANAETFPARGRTRRIKSWNNFRRREAFFPMA